MKEARREIIDLLRVGYCTPKLSAIAKRLRIPVTTVQYNVKRLERERSVLTYKAVLNHKKVGEGFCTYVLINLSPDEYGDPERIARELAVFPQVECVDIITGDWEIIAKVRTKDIDEYYEFVKRAIARKGIVKIKSLNSLKQVKTEYILTEG